MTYIMRGSQDCGPAALSEALGWPYETILEKWPGGWKNSGKGRLGTPNDTPPDHFALLSKFGVPWRIVDDSMILAGMCKPGKTIILFHDPDKPTLSQHWVILSGVSIGVAVACEMGHGSSSTFTAETFRMFYRKGWPNCAYEVGLGSGRLSWWQRLIAYTTGKYI